MSNIDLKCNKEDLKIKFPFLNIDFNIKESSIKDAGKDLVLLSIITNLVPNLKSEDN